MIYEFIIMFLGCVYPAYATYLSMNSGQQSQVQWIKYWIVFGAFVLFHFLTGWLESWVPFLGSFKLCVLLWLLPSVGGGCLAIHDEFLLPLLTRKREHIHRTFERVSRISSVVLRVLVKMLYHLLVDVAEQCCQLTRNADDLNVTPRLQSAINKVIEELRAARLSAFPNHDLSSEPLWETDQEQESEESDASLNTSSICQAGATSTPVSQSQSLSGEDDAIESNKEWSESSIRKEQEWHHTEHCDTLEEL